MRIADIPQAYLAAFILQIAALLMDGACGDAAEARQAACRMLSSYEPRNEVELRLIARIIGFNLQSGAALSQAADPATPLARVIRLRSGAVAMAREAEKAERRLEKLRAVVEEAPIEEPAPVPAEVAGTPIKERFPEPATAEVFEASMPEQVPAAEHMTVAEFAKAHGLTWTQAHQERNRQKRLAARRAKQERQAAAA